MDFPTSWKDKNNLSKWQIEEKEMHLQEQTEDYPWRRIWTLLHWILLVSKVVCVRPGKRCFKERKRLSALSASNSLLSPSTIRSLTISHDDFAVERFGLVIGLWWVLRRHTYIEASTRFAISKATCSEDRSRQSSRHSEENWSDVIYR